MQGVRTTVFRDYFVPSRLVRFTALRPIEPPPQHRSAPYRLGARIVMANSRLYDMVLGMPARLEEDWLLLRDRDERRLMRRALFDDRLLTGDRRRAIMSILFWSLVILWASAGLVVALVDRQALRLYHAGFSLFFYSAATTVFLPTPFEILLASSRQSLGVFWTVAIAAAAKTAGSWVVLLAGDRANEGLQQIMGRGLAARVFKRVQGWAQRYGYTFVFVTLSIPFMSDTIPIFLAAMLRMRKVPFLVVTCIAIVVRSLLFLYAPGLVGDIVGRFTG